jgi:hypothetical protein
MLVRKPDVVEEETSEQCDCHRHNHSMHVTDGMTVISLFASRLWKICVAPDWLCQIAVNPKLLLKFGKWCKFSSNIKAKSHKQKV